MGFEYRTHTPTLFGTQGSLILDIVVVRTLFTDPAPVEHREACGWVRDNCPTGGGASPHAYTVRIVLSCKILWKVSDVDEM